MANDEVTATCENCGFPSATRIKSGHVLCALCADLYALECGTIRFHLETALEHLAAISLLRTQSALTKTFVLTEDVEELFTAVVERITFLMAHRHRQQLP